MSNRRTLYVIAIISALFLPFQNCSNIKFADSNSNFSSSQSATGDLSNPSSVGPNDNSASNNPSALPDPSPAATPAPAPAPIATPSPAPAPTPVVTPSPSPSLPSLPVVCDPFDKKNVIDPKQGIQGQIYSAGARLNPANCANHSTCTSRDYINLGTPINATLFMSDLFVPTRNFTQGFDSGNGALTDTRGQTLIEWFALDLKSKFTLAPDEPEGMYQVALISDDGVTLTVNNQNILVSEGEHSPRLDCANQIIVLKKGDQVPFRLTYFQGPRTQIALVALWRKVDLGANLSDCGSSNGEISSADALPASLVAKGWRVMRPANFYLTEGSNLCTQANQ